MNKTDSYAGRNAEGTFSEGHTPKDPMRARAEKAERERDTYRRLNTANQNLLAKAEAKLERQRDKAERVLKMVEDCATADCDTCLELLKAVLNKFR